MSEIRPISSRKRYTFCFPLCLDFFFCLEGRIILVSICVIVTSDQDNTVPTGLHHSANTFAICYTTSCSKQV